MSGRPSEKIITICAVHRPMPLISVRRSYTSSFDSRGRSSNSPRATSLATVRMQSLFVLERPMFRSVARRTRDNRSGSSPTRASRRSRIALAACTDIICEMIARTKASNSGRSPMGAGPIFFMSRRMCLSRPSTVFTLGAIGK